jgi:hypothetical protein
MALRLSRQLTHKFRLSERSGRDISSCRSPRLRDFGLSTERAKGPGRLLTASTQPSVPAGHERCSGCETLSRFHPHGNRSVPQAKLRRIYFGAISGVAAWRNRSIRNLFLCGMTLIAAIVVNTAIMVSNLRDHALSDSEPGVHPAYECHGCAC